MTMYTESLRAFLKPVLPFLDDDHVSEILINGPNEVWIERKGKLSRTDARFSEEGLLGAARNIAQFVGRPLSDERPRLDARLPDGSRIHIILPPVARCGTTITIRKFFREKLSIDSLVRFDSLNQPMARLLEAIVRSKLNVVVAGGTASGKTTLLNILTSTIPQDERIVTIEDSVELQPDKEHLVSLESRPADKFGKGEVTLADLLMSSLRLRPDRIIVGEVRGGECFYLVQAMNTGHGGTMSTVHANTPVDTLRRLESLCLLSSVELPLVAVRAQVASAIHIVVLCERLSDGARKVVRISEVLPLTDRGEYRTRDLFVYTPVTRDAQGTSVGYHGPTGMLPRFLGKLRSEGFSDLDEAFFDPATYQLPPPPAFLFAEETDTAWAPSLAHRARGEPDPQVFADHWRAFEHHLRQQAAQAQRRPTPVPNQPTLNRRSEAEQRPPPPEERTATGMGSRAPPPDPGTEPKIEISSELLNDALKENTSVRTYPPPPPRPLRPPQASNRPGPQVGAPRPIATARPATELQDGPTEVKATPDRNRR